ncbi:MAG: thrombospondin type 3 repeat-containing protein, partial [Candidatus Thiodiazotropha endolucinida]
MKSLFDTSQSSFFGGGHAQPMTLQKRLRGLICLFMLLVTGANLQAAVDVPYPYATGFDTADEQALWLVNGHWGITTGTPDRPSQSGDYHLDNNPDALDQYAANSNHDAVADWRVAIPLDAVNPVLSYHYQLHLLSSDNFYVEVRDSETSPWTRLKVYTRKNNHGGYVRETLDLSSFRGQSIQLRFNQRNSYNHGARLWLIDDLRVGEEQLPALTYPYVNGFETVAEQADWNRQGTWEVLDEQGARVNHGGGYHLDNNPGELDQYAYNSGQLATLNGTIAIPADASRPVLSYWYQLELGNSDNYYVDIRPLGETAWTLLKKYTRKDNHGGYVRETLDLSAYQGQSIQLRFRQGNAYNHAVRLWLIDDLQVGEEQLPALTYPYVNGFETEAEQADWNRQGTWEVLDEQGARVNHGGGYHLDNNPGELDQYAYNSGQLATLNGAIAIPADAIRPVLSYWYQLELGNSDNYYVDIRPLGETAWTLLKKYTRKDNHGGYVRETLDLSAYLGQSIQLRFRQGNAYNHAVRLWLIDDLQVGEEQLPALTYPYVNGFETEAEQADWNRQGTWEVLDEQGARVNHGGGYHLDNNPGELDQYAYNSGQLATLNGAIAIPADAIRPVLSYWYQLELGNSDNYYVDIRPLGETAWTLLKKYTRKDNHGGYVRETLDLSAYLGQSIQLRFRQGNAYNHAVRLWLIDDLQVGEEQLPALTYPYVNGFETEAEQADWNRQGTWEVLDEQGARVNHGGGYHLDNNPGELDQYAYNSGQLATLNGTIAIPADASRPVLSYWYQLELGNSDNYYVDIRPLGETAWTLLKKYTRKDNHNGYVRETLDLSAYLGQSIQLRFRQGNAYNHAVRLWLIDDLEVGEEQLPVLTYPYVNGFETVAEQADWNRQGTWEVLDEQGARVNHGGGYHLDNNPGELDQYAYNSGQLATLNGAIAIPADAIQPALNFWSRLQLNSSDNYYVDIRPLGEIAWTTLKNYRAANNSSVYQLEVLDLSAYRGQSIQLRFRQRNAYNHGARLWLIDDLRVGVDATYDQDGDGTPDFEDSDRDGDGVENAQDVFPDNSNEWSDLDSDGIGDNSDPDRDGDGVVNEQDAFPDNPGESSDLDGDGVGDNSDPDRDGDGIGNDYETQLGFDPDNAASVPPDLDGDRIPDALDDDRDGDGVNNTQDAFPDDAAESSDLDGDGIGDNSDPDRDGDGFSNEEEIQAGTNPDNPQHYPDQVAPQLTLDGLTERVTDAATIDLRGGVSDDNSGLASLTLASDRFPGVAMAAIVTNGQWTANVPLEIGINLITLTALDQAGNQAQLGLSVERQSADSQVALVIDYPQSNSVVNEPEIVIRGLFRIETPAQVMSVTVDGAPLVLTDTALNTEFRFESAPLALSEGLNSFLVRGEADGQVATRQVSVTYQPDQQTPAAPQIRVLTPVSGSYLYESGFTLAGEIDAPGQLASLSLNGTPVAFTDLHSGLYAFREMVGFESGASQLTIDLVAEDDQGQVATLQVEYLRDQEAPVIVIDQALDPAPAENQVNEQPYRLQGSIMEANLSAFTINDIPVALTPGVVDGEYRFDTALQLNPGESLPLVLTAHDLAGNRSSLDYLLRLDASVSLAMLLPATGTELIQTGAPIPLQLAVEISGVGAADVLANAELHNAGGSVVATAALFGDAGVKGGEIEVPAQAGDYDITVTVSDSGGQILAVTHRRLLVKDPVEVPLELERMEPADGQQGVEPNGFISFYFNQPIDITELTLSVHETAHGYTYQDLDEPGTPALNAQGYQLVEISRSYEPVPGSLSLLPGDRVVAFYPGRELAYGGEVFVDVSYAGEEIHRSLFRTRPLPTFINGTVVDQFGQPIPGISITIPELGRSTKTNSDGAFAFGYRDRYDQTIPGGRYELRINPE